MKHLHFFKYFLNYIFRSKTRQRLLFVAITGLSLSSFSLMSIQGVMSGLQNGLINRSKKVLGAGVIKIPFAYSQEKIKELSVLLENEKIIFIFEQEVELLLKHEDKVIPLILRGIDFQKTVPPFLKNKDYSGLVLGTDAALKLDVRRESMLSIVSPSHVDSIMGDVPRSVTSKVTDYYMSELPEIDSVTGWTRLSLVQNLTGELSINGIRAYSELTPNIINWLKENNLVFDSWEKINQTLVWALKLETTVMILLFAAMSLLVSFAITSGFMIFFDKTKSDLMSFWILGHDKAGLMRMMSVFTHLLAALFSLIGILGATLFLYLLKSGNFNIMPDLFVERSVPVAINFSQVLLSFGIPYLIAAVFSYMSLSIFKKENQNFIQLIRQVGR